MADRALPKSAVLESWTLMVCLSVREPPLSREANCCLRGCGQEEKTVFLIGKISTKCDIHVHQSTLCPP